MPPPQPAEEAGFAALFALAPVPWIVLDDQLRVTRANAAIGDVLHVAAEKLAGRGLADAGVHAQIATAWEKPLRDALATGRPSRFEFVASPEQPSRPFFPTAPPAGARPL